MAATTAPARKRIIFTGGSGKAGRHAIPYLLSKGHLVLNLDLNPLPSPLDNDVYTLKTDLTDAGQVFSALTSNFSLASYSNSRHSTNQPVPPVDAVIHFGAQARNLLVPDTECFKTNVLSTYNVLESACKLGIPKVILASSETVYGVCFAQGDTDYDHFPLDEDDYDCNPMDTYALSKLCNERCGRSFNRRFPGTDVYALRIGNVIEPHEYGENFAAFVNQPETRKRNAWSYVDARDLGQVCDLCLGERAPAGFEVFNATNSCSTLKEPTVGFLRRECPGVEIRRAMGEFEAPLSNRKVREVLGFEEGHGWRKYVDV